MALQSSRGHHKCKHLVNPILEEREQGASIDHTPTNAGRLQERNQKQRREPLAGGEAAGDSELRTVEYGHVTLADPVAVWLARWWRITGAMTAISRVGGEARKETIRGVGFSPATLPLVAGVDGGVPRRPWDLRQRQGLLESWWLEANGERVSRIKKKGACRR
ncbi:hypothetical protein DEO72_LG11g2754 [Vigna unguiculata]|uniref:Uncharacterized protein n=1 Tax=Vigna unguiculata TaxID=3917 RepID=A0A4D6NRY9_VIGUN|nr:hypothetical protein DEO72_LG11g2754 [Vigna unguiculata]